MRKRREIDAAARPGEGGALYQLMQAESGLSLFRPPFGKESHDPAKPVLFFDAPGR
jgi:hypothetical protein